MNKRLLIILLGLVFFGFFAVLLSQNFFSFDHKKIGPAVKADDCKLKIIVLDVGQGDAILILTPSGENILIDAGPDNKIIQKLGQYLKFNKDIRLLVLTHPHSDHVSGMSEVLKRYEVDSVLMTGVIHTTADYLSFLDEVKSRKIEAIAASSTAALPLIRDIDLKILYPVSNLTGEGIDNLNNSSIVLKLAYISSTALFTGDFENEESLLGLYSSSTLKSQLLKVGHHGSTNANSWEFLRAVSPELAAIPVGLDNSYGHPHFRVLNELKKAGAEIFRTDQLGDLIFCSNGQDFRKL